MRQLAVAWTFHTGETHPDSAASRGTSLETTPLVVDGTMYLSTPLSRVIALDPETGRERWTYDPLVELQGDYGDGLINRGVAIWLDPARRPGEPCHCCLFEALDARLIALDAATGSPCADFGSKGQLSLRHVPRYRAGVVSHDLAAGRDRRSRHRLQHQRQRAHEAHLRRRPRVRCADGRTEVVLGSAAAGGGCAIRRRERVVVIAADSARDLVFVPTGSASPDYYGGERVGDNRYANSIVALRASTGKVACGISRRCTTTSGTSTTRLPRCSVRSRVTADASTS